MLFKVIWKEDLGYLCPIFSEFEKNYLLSEIDMLLSNSCSNVRFDNFKKGRIFAYSIHQPGHDTSEIAGILKDCLLELFEKYPYIKREFNQESLLKYACTGSGESVQEYHVSIDYSLARIKEMIMNGFENYIYKIPNGHKDLTMEDFFMIYNNT